MTLEKYLAKISDTRARLHAIVARDGNGRSEEFQQVSKELDKVWRNARAWCRKHGVEFPYHEAMYC